MYLYYATSHATFLCHFSIPFFPLYHTVLSYPLTLPYLCQFGTHLCNTIFATPHHFAKQLVVSFGTAGVFPLRATVPDLMPQRNNPSREIFGHNKSAINSLFLLFFVQEPGNVFTMLYFLRILQMGPIS
jgi:hypothetical protein